ncbi:hypothetical protein [Luteimonas sp. MC1825]|uniref:hypothetical protein n=1 Tax=Luteimonas sp. MC1825 TaxID=2761107 RepID=UPI0016230B71|nr:hypothetical protein [Luteimonas sp. MC1825]MBB6598746.1 hypothetical protein [Luteimonas sp. MC1825]QOC88910.1 hypothetical protein IDM46_03970 [Luteimonas sp. MC1825]
MTTIQETASQILDVGQRRFWADDYEKRMDTFADVVEGLDPAARAQLFDEILEQDSGATMSWLTVDRLDSLAREGRITANERSAVLEGFGDAYVAGEIGFQDAMAFTNIFGSGAVGGIGLNPDPAQLEALLGTLSAANGGDPGFIEKFATAMLQQRLYSEPMAVLPHERDALAGVLLNALDEAGGSSSVHNALSSLSGGQKAALLESLASSGLAFRNPSLDGTAVRDPMAIVIEATSRHGGSQDALEMVRFVSASSTGNVLENHFHDMDNKPYEERADALGELFLTHGDVILTDLTVADPGQTVGSSNDRSTVTGENLLALSNLVRITGLNPDNPRADAVMDMVGDFAAANIRAGNLTDQDDVNGDGEVNALDIEARDAGNGRAAMIGAIMQDAVSSGYVDLRADIAARDAFVGFVLDVAISAIPVGGDFAAKAITDQVSGALGGLSEAVRDRIAESLAAIPKDLLTDAQGQLTAAAKDAIIEALPEDYQYLEGIKGESNTLIADVILSASLRDYQLTESMGEYRSYIDQARGD